MEIQGGKPFRENSSDMLTIRSGKTILKLLIFHLVLFYSLSRIVKPQTTYKEYFLKSYNKECHKNRNTTSYWTESKLLKIYIILSFFYPHYWNKKTCRTNFVFFGLMFNLDEKCQHFEGIFINYNNSLIILIKI